MQQEVELQPILNALQKTSPDIEACAFVTLEGEVMAGTTGDATNAFGPMLAKLAARTIETLDDEIDEVVLRGKNIHAVMMGSKAPRLLVLAKADAKLGLLRLEMKRALVTAEP